MHRVIRYLKAEQKGPLIGRRETIDGQWQDEGDCHRAEPQKCITISRKKGTVVKEGQTFTQRDSQINPCGALTTFFIGLNF